MEFFLDEFKIKLYPLKKDDMPIITYLPLIKNSFFTSENMDIPLYKETMLEMISDIVNLYVE